MGNITANYVEFDLPYCALDFAQSPCTATGTPCFNTRNLSHDCGDPDNYTETKITVRFVESNGFDYWPLDGVTTMPILERADSQSAKIMPAESMGLRGTCNIRLKNGLSSMGGLDKNIIARENPFDSGTFLGKFKARFPFIFSSEVRVYRGTVGGTFNVEHYTIDDFSGPDNSGGMTFKCVDFLKLTDGKTSQFPAPTEGVLLTAMDENVTTFTVQPVGIGDIQYPSSGKVAVGKEGMTFTRAGDVFTVTRGLYGKIEPHAIDDNVQLIGEYSSQTSAQIIYDLITNYTPLDASYIDFDEWQSEVNSFQNALYSAEIAKPEPVNKLINEIIEQAGLIFYADVVEKKIKLKVLRPVSSTQKVDTDVICGFSQKENQKKRVSQVWTYYNQKDPLEKLDDEFNYYSALISPSLENLYPTEVIKKIYSRWIPSFAQSVALDLNSRVLQRYVNPPRDFSFSLFIDHPVSLGSGLIVEHRALEDAFGNPDQRPSYVTSLDYGDIEKRITAQEYVFTEYTGEGGGGNVIITIDENSTSVSLRSIYDTVYSSLEGIASITFRLKSGTFIGGQNPLVYAMNVGDFGGITPTLIIEQGAYIVGAGGQGNGQETDAGRGGDAINADFPIAIDNNGTIAGAGGAGGKGLIRVTSGLFTGGQGLTISAVTWGGAGAGYIEGGGFYLPVADIYAPGKRLEGSTAEEAKAYYESFPNTEVLQMLAGAGGDLGQAGSIGPDGAGGAPGAAVTNNSNITWIDQGQIIGAIN